MTINYFSADVSSPTFDLTNDGLDFTYSTINETTEQTTGVETGTEMGIDSQTDVPVESGTDSPVDEVTEGLELVTETSIDDSSDLSADGVTEVESEGITTETSDLEATTMMQLEEGSCLKNKVVYANQTNVPQSSPCQEFCMCDDGEVKCELLACPPSPPSFLRCTPIEQNDQCCPSYDCRKFDIQL